MRATVLAFGMIAAALARADTDARGGLGSFDEAGDIPGCILGESFDTLNLQLIDGFGLVHLLDDGGQVQTLDATEDFVDNASAVSAPAFAGPAGGPDPDGERGGMLQGTRRGLAAPGFGIETAEAAHNLYAPAHGRPLFVQFDIYRHDHSTFAAWRPFSSVESLFVTGLFIGGAFYDAHPLFSPLAAVRGDAELIESVAILGLNPDGGPNGEFFLGAKDLPENEWVTLGVLLTTDSMSVWVRDSETLAGESAIGVRTPMRTSGPLAGTRMFSEMGFGLEAGWAQLYPGTQDDPATLDITEGFGRAVWISDLDPNPADFLIDANGNVVGPIWAGTSVDAWRLFVGSDPDPKDAPGYVAKNWWFDDYCVRGGRRVDACPADLDGDGTVGASDLAALLAAWGDSGGAADLDGSDLVDAGDLAVLLAAWGPCP